MKERFLARDYRFLAVCGVLLGLTTWYSVRNFYRAFPEASIDFRVNREASESMGARFLAGRGYRLEGYRHAASFTYDDNAKTFLEREVGLEQANRIMGSRIRLWRWSHRWFRPQQKEEFRAEITPRGEMAGFSHEVPEDAARPAATAEEARTLADEFLRTVAGREPAALEFVEVSEVARPRRVDRVFTWKERDFNLRDSSSRLEVTLLGGEVGGYREYLKVPDQWLRDYARLRSKNDVASTVDSAVLVLLVVGLAVVIVLRVRRHDINWRAAAVVGMLGMGLSFLAQLNQMPLEEFAYPTTDSYGSFMMRQLLDAVIAALGSGGLLFVLTAGAEPLYREAFRDKVALSHLFSARGLRTKRFFLGTVLGITLTGVFIAYQTAFYIISYRFGAWSPADVPYSDLLNTRFPWAFVLFGGFLPAVSEEFLFRMFSIPFLRKATRTLAVAIVAAGFIWGFGHAAYPQQPFYIRGVEVGIGGVALGLVMLRWGILPTLVWHYSVDAMYSAMLLLRSESLYFRLSGAASAGILVLPAAAALLAYWRKGGFEPETGLLNADHPAPDAPPAEAAPEPAQAEGAVVRPALGSRRRAVAAAVLLAGLAALLIPVSRFGAAPVYRISDEQARAAADGFLRGRGIDPAPFRSVTFPAVHWSGDDSLTGKYFLERMPAAAASRLIERNRPIRYWVTRYFKSLNQEEMLVTVHPETSRPMGFNHTLPEDRPGADIPLEGVRGAALAFAAAQGIDLNGMDLKESRSEKKKARRDHTLVWEARAGDPRNLDQARFRVELQVAGDAVSSWRSFWKLPEAFTRARERQNFLSISAAALRLGVTGALIVFALWMLLKQIRRGGVAWKKVIAIAIPAAILTAVGPLLSLRLLLENYNTAVPLETYEAMSYLFVGMAVVFGFLLMGAAAALLLSWFPRCLAEFAAGARRALAGDAAAALAAAIGLALIAARAGAWLMDRFHGQAIHSFSAADILVYQLPALAAAAAALRSVLVNGALVAAVALLAQRLPKRWMAALLAPLAALALLPPDLRTPGELLLSFGISLMTAGGVAAFAIWFGRSNYLAWGLVLWLAAMRAPILELLSNPYRAYQINGWAAAAIAAALAVWALAPGLMRLSSDRTKVS